MNSYFDADYLCQISRQSENKFANIYEARENSLADPMNR